jgi:hypothetical protein
MGVAGLKERGSAGEGAGCFHSAVEMREVLERLLKTVDDDAVLGVRMRATRVPHRFVFSDIGLVLNVTSCETGDHNLLWGFGDDVGWEPELTLEMDSEVANRYLQGLENIAIAIARKRIRVSSPARAVLSFVPSSGALIGPYNELIRREYPHLVLS